MKKIYKVTVKVEYEITMFHTQDNKRKAINDVKSVVDGLLNSKDSYNLKVLFDDSKPKARYKAVIKNDNDK